MTSIRVGLILLMLTQLGGCSLGQLNKDPAQVGWDASMAALATKDRPTRLSFSILAFDDVNPNQNGEATPIAFQLFQLEDDSKLLAADYDSLIADHEATLGKNYVDHSDFTMLPGQFKFIESTAIAPDTRYIGVLAHYGDPEASRWKKVIKVRSTGREYHLLVLLKDQEVILDKVE